MIASTIQFSELFEPVIDLKFLNIIGWCVIKRLQFLLIASLITSRLQSSETKILVNSLFMFPIFWLLFNIYQMTFIGNRDA